MKNNIIVTDVDGVLVDWEQSFDAFMTERGYAKVDPEAYSIGLRYNIPISAGKRLIREFNESSHIENLTPLRDAVEYINRLNDIGYKFHCITSLSNKDDAHSRRRKNLTNLFGNVIDRFVILDTGADKDQALEEYQDTQCVWVEDKVTNAVVGSALGLDSIIMQHNYNRDYVGTIRVVSTWKEIYNYVVSGK